jgi:hypothetical protein
MGRRRKYQKGDKSKFRSHRFRAALEGDFKSLRPKDRRWRKHCLDWYQLMLT